MESNQIFNYSHCSDSPMNRIKKNRVFPTHEAESLVGTGSEEESNSVPGWRGRNLQRKNSIEQPSSIKEQSVENASYYSVRRNLKRASHKRLSVPTVIGMEMY